MNRKEKISVLIAIKEGLIKNGFSFETKNYLFTEIVGKKGYYIKEGIEFTESERIEFCKEIESKNSILHSLNLRENITITMNIYPKELKGDNAITLVLS